ncbi:MAG: PaaI family thioesterase [Acidimicrobiia bacterium]
MTPESITTFLRTTMSSADTMGFVCTEVGNGTATIRWPYNDLWIRPGKYVSGPLLMALADTTLYCAVFGALGRIEPMAVTSELSTSFLHPAIGTDVTAHATLLRFSGRAAYGEVRMRADSDPEVLVAHATGTYVIPV